MSTLFLTAQIFPYIIEGKVFDKFLEKVLTIYFYRDTI